MPLLDLKTNLKSLKYGNDQPGGGSSGQPYVTTDINKVDTGFNRFRLTKFDDGLVRGGFVGATNASIVDTIRIGKFLTDFPKGPLFITKQVGLQLSNPRLEVKKLKTDNPTRGGGLLRNVGNFILNTANKIQNAVGPTRIYNLGINTLAQVPVNAFGGHLNRHGFLPVQDDQTKYFSVVLNNNDKDNNRLVQLKDKLIGTENNIIDNYIGGPSSVYGIGRTLIRRRGDFIVVNQDITGNEWAVKGAKEAGINYRLIGHEGGTQDGYTDASRRITNFTGVSDKTGSLFAPSPIFYKDKRSIQSVFGGRRGNTPVNLDDKIASNSDITDSKYNATTQEASASAKMRTPSAFVGASTKTSSSFISNNFPNLTSVGTYKRTTLEDKIASSDDPKKDTYIASGSEASASAKMRDSNTFVGVSKNKSSIFVSNNFPDLTSVGTYKRDTLKDKIASANDVSDNLLNKPGINQITASADLGVSNQYFSGSQINIYNPNITTYSGVSTADASITVNNSTNKIVDIEIVNKGNVPLRNASYQKYQQIIESRKLRETTYILDNNQINAFGLYGKDFPIKETLGNILPDSTQLPVYSNKDKVVKINIPWNKVTREQRVGSGKQDVINLTPIFGVGANSIPTNEVTIEGKPYNITDLVPFRIIALNGDNPDSALTMVFRAYITQLTDNTDPKWNPVQYVGRGEEFYIYNGFTRKIQISFKVAALSVEEMEPMYQKLNFLMGNVMPDYTSNGLMRGSMVKMTVGNWIKNQDGILTSVGYTIPNDSPWEVSLNNEELILPHIVEVSLGFTPIGSQTKGVNKVAAKDLTTSHIGQN